MVHLLALAAFGGAVLTTALRANGYLFKPYSPNAPLMDLGWLLAGSLASMLVSGFLLFADGPLRYYGNPAFRAKLVLIGAAMALGFAAYWVQWQCHVSQPPTATIRLLVLVSSMFWLGAAIAGRVVGVL